MTFFSINNILQNCSLPQCKYKKYIFFYIKTLLNVILKLYLYITDVYTVVTLSCALNNDKKVFFYCNTLLLFTVLAYFPELQ